MFRTAFVWAAFSLSAATCHAQFHLLGDASHMPGDCIMLTPDEQYSEGLAYHQRKLDLTQYFEIEFDIYLGNKDDMGADGIVFVVHNDVRGFRAHGAWGENMGYGRWYRGSRGIAPSIAIEFDTYQNYAQNDPACDHVAYLENGTNFHIDHWHDDDPNFDLEDDLMHNFRLIWDPTETLLTVFLDNRVVHQGRKDLVKEIFQGETQVIWGFTASTGNKHNLQYFCLRKWAVNDQGSNEMKDVRGE